MLRHSRGLPGLYAGLKRVLACCGLALLFSASPSFAQSTTGLKKTTQATSTTAAASAVSSAQPSQFEGLLEVVHEDDFKNKKGRTRYFLKAVSGARYELKFKKGQPQHEPGSKLRVQGTQSGSTVTLDSAASSLQVLAAPAPGLSSLGEQKTAVLLVNFQDQPANKPWTTAQWNSFMFGTASDSVNHFFLENSYQQTWLTGNTFGWYTLPINSTDPCDQNNIAAAAKSAAAAAGVDISSYTRLVFAFPANSCTWSGLSSTVSVPSQSFINGGMALNIVTHELGHALGLFHSHGLDCDVSATGNNCAYAEYGDKVDTMGVGLGHFNAAQKERLGWLNYNVSPPITTVQSSGSYVIEPIETGGSTSTKGLKILKGTDPTSGAKTWYYLEYRQPVGLDSYISSSSIYYPQNILGGVLVHTATDGAGNSNYELDMTPGSLNAYATQDLSDAALVVGKSYTDTAAGVTITPTWANSTGIGVDVTFTKSSCTRANPSVAMSSQGSTVPAGSAVTYTVAVTNNDSSGCGASTFNLQGTLPTGWTGVWAASTLSVGAGSAASTSVTVTSTSSSIAGTYSVTGKATNSGAASYNGSGSGSYVIGSSSTTTTTKGKGHR